MILTQPIYFGIHEVMQRQYAQVMGRNPSQFSATGASKGAVSGLDTSRHPVEMVSWHDAAEFCVKLSEREKLKRFSPTGTRKAADFGLAAIRQPFAAEALDVRRPNGRRKKRHRSWTADIEDFWRQRRSRKVRVFLLLDIDG